MLRVAAREDSGVYVMGEVNKPATVLPMRNGSLTLSQAISRSGSFELEHGRIRSRLFVIRNSTSDKPEIYHLDATSPVSMVLANSSSCSRRTSCMSVKADWFASTVC